MPSRSRRHALRCNQKPSRTQTWQSYEEAARSVLNELAARFGLLQVEGKQLVAGLKSGTRWELDGKGVCLGDAGFLIVEARRVGRRLTQEATAGIAYRVWDTGTRGALVVTPVGFQEGAKLIAEQANIISVQLDPESTPERYVLRLLQEIMMKPEPDSFDVSTGLVGAALTTVIPDPEGSE
ncbi:MAG: hypothetical protein QM750_07830 [Rubrivivax sp.]